MLTRRELFKALGLGAAAMAMPRAARLLAETAARQDQPNVILILTDDQGYADLGCYGSTTIQTPCLDRMASEGVRFTDFYVAAPVCSASRAALMTGCYAERVGGLGALMPDSPKDASMGRDGLSPQEVTVADVLKARGYATACVGKWHLGHRPPFLPTKQGFDAYFGIPYSNDMGPSTPWGREMQFPPLPLMEGEKVVETNPDQSLLTRRYTQKSLEFIRANKDKPFFLYLAHSMPHWPLAASGDFRGKSKAGLYGDTIQEIDWSTGQLLATLKELGLDEKTLVVFLSDNGPWLIKGAESGSAGALRDGKWSLYEGGMRVPCIVRMPGKIKPQISPALAASMDLMPTIAAAAGAAMPADRVTDGKDLWPLLTGKADKSPRETFVFCGGAIREGKWKYHAARANDTQMVRGPKGKWQKITTPTKAALYDLSTDPGESKNVAAANPEVAARLAKMLDEHNKELAAHSRPAGSA